MPELGENIEEGDVVKWLVAEGDTVAREQPLLEIETGKATLELPAPAAGTIARLAVAAGDKVKIGQVLAVFSDGGGGSAPPPAPGAPGAAAAPKPPEPADGAASEPAPDAAPADGAAAEPSAAAASGAPAPKPARVPVAAAPSVRRFAREVGVAIEDVAGSGANGRIGIDDVKAHAKRLLAGGGRRGPGGPEPEPLPDFSAWGPVRTEPMSRLRTTAAEHLARAWATIPHVTQHDKADITELEALRKRFAAARGGGRAASSRSPPS